MPHRLEAIPPRHILYSHCQIPQRPLAQTRAALHPFFAANKFAILIYMRAVLLVLSLFFYSFAAGTELTDRVLTLAQQRQVLNGASWAAVAQYTDGEPLFAIEPHLRLAPASTLKLLTSAAALETLGPMYRFETPVYADALPDADGTLDGNLYIRGSADPTLGSDRVSGSLSAQQLLQSWSRQIRDLGIRKITGHIYADTSLFSGPSLPDKTNWQNMGNYFAAPATALAFHDNSFEIAFAPQAKDGAPVAVQSVWPETEGLKIRSFVTASAKDKRDNAYVYAAPGQYDLEIYGTVPVTRLRGQRIQAALPDAPQLLADMLLQQLEKDGVSVGGGAILLENAPDYTAMHLLFAHHSPPLKDIIYVLNKRSFNFYAEMLLRMLAVQAGQSGSVAEGIKQLYAFLQANGISTHDLVLYDGSGLSRDNQLPAQTLLEVLVFMSTRPNFPYYYDSLATLDDRGDLLLLRYFLHPFKRTQDVHVKGGTIDGVKAQAGYAKDRNGRLIAFAFIANNLLDKDESINRFYEDVLKLLLQLPQP